MQIDNYTKNIVDTSSNVVNIMSAMGFDVVKCDGHDVSDIKKAIKAKTKKPKFIVELGFAKFHHSVLGQEYVTRILEKMHGKK